MNTKKISTFLLVFLSIGSYAQNTQTQKSKTPNYAYQDAWEINKALKKGDYEVILNLLTKYIKNTSSIVKLDDFDQIQTIPIKNIIIEIKRFQTSSLSEIAKININIRNINTQINSIDRSIGTLDLLENSPDPDTSKLQNYKTIIKSKENLISNRNNQNESLQKLKLELEKLTKDFTKLENIRHISNRDIGKIVIPQSTPIPTIIVQASNAGSGNFQSNLIDGLSKFIAERAKEELNIAFFQKFQKAIEKTNLGILFPEVKSILAGTNSFNYTITIQVLKEAFEQDIANVLTNLPNFLKESNIIKSEEAFFYLALVNRTFQRLEKGTNIHTMITFMKTQLQEKEDKNEFEGKLLNILEASEIITYALVGREGKSKSFWISESDFNELQKDKELRDIYFGLVYEQLLHTGLKGEINGDWQNGEWQSEWMKLYNTFTTLEAKVDILKVQLKKQEKPTINDFLDISISSIEILESFLSSELVNKTYWGDKLKPTIEKAKKFQKISKDIYLSIQTKNYGAIATNLIHFLNELKVFNYKTNIELEIVFSSLIDVLNNLHQKSDEKTVEESIRSLNEIIQKLNRKSLNDLQIQKLNECITILKDIMKKGYNVSTVTDFNKLLIPLSECFPKSFIKNIQPFSERLESFIKGKDYKSIIKELYFHLFNSYFDNDFPTIAWTNKDDFIKKIIDKHKNFIDNLGITIELENILKDLLNQKNDIKLDDIKNLSSKVEIFIQKTHIETIIRQDDKNRLNSLLTYFYPILLEKPFNHNNFKEKWCKVKKRIITDIDELKNRGTDISESSQAHILSLFKYLKRTKSENINIKHLNRYFLNIIPTQESKESINKEEIIKYISFMVSIIKAKNSDEVKQAIKSVALPAGSYSIKRKSLFNISINSFVGFTGGLEQSWNKLKDTSNTYSTGGWHRNIGFSAPVGVAFSWGSRSPIKKTDLDEVDSYFMPFKNGNNKYKKLGGASHSIFVSIIDLGALVSFRLQDNTSNLPQNIKFSQVVAPGVFYIYGMKNAPVSFFGGAQFNPQLRKVNADNLTFGNKPLDVFRFNIGVVLDIPLFNLYTKIRKNNKYN